MEAYKILESMTAIKKMEKKTDHYRVN